MKNLAKSLGEFHWLMKELKKDATNPFFKSNYVTLDNILNSIKVPLKTVGLTFIQMPSTIGEHAPALKTMLIHIESGESISDVTPIVMSKQDPQAQGSAITYMRRYALVSMLGLSTDTDDDANSALRSSQGSTEETIDLSMIDYEDAQEMSKGFSRAITKEELPAVRR